MTSILNGVLSVGSALPFAVVVRCSFNSSGHCSTEMSPSALVITGTKIWLFGGIVRHCASFISSLLSASELSVQCAGSGACCMLTAATVSFRFARIGASRDPTKRTIPTLESISFT